MGKSPGPIKETDLYPPLKAWLEAQGYVVRGEVGRCDVAARRGDELVVVELKNRPSMALLAQAAERQEYADAVYVALPVTRDKPNPPAGRDLRRLLRRLGIGLITVKFLQKRVGVEILLHPGDHSIRRRPKRRQTLLREMDGRDLDLTAGGSVTGAIRFTAYRHRAFRIACLLETQGEAGPARLRELGAADDTGVILSSNRYGWFERVRRGVYRLHDVGMKALNNWPELRDHYHREFLRDQAPSTGK
jgi:hypothetical protein